MGSDITSGVTNVISRVNIKCFIDRSSDGTTVTRLNSRSFVGRTKMIGLDIDSVVVLTIDKDVVCILIRGSVVFDTC